MRILIDGIRLTKKPDGVINITICIINALCLNFPNYELIILTNNKLHPDVASQLSNSENIIIVIKKTFLLKNTGLYWSLFKLNSLIKKYKADFFLEPNSIIYPFFFPKKTKLILYIHDLVYLLYPKSMSIITKMNMKLLQSYSIKRADYFWVNSNYTKSELLKYFKNQVKDKLIFTGSGINHDFTISSKKYSSKVDDFQFINRKYILFVGTQEPRKNITFLLNLFSQIKDESYNLVIVGSNGWGKSNTNIQNIINSSNFPNDRVFFTGYVDNNQLIRIYRSAYIFISTSLNEGLGLPQLEAMSQGVPVISPCNSAMEEVVSGAGVTIKSWDIKDWINGINEIEKNRFYYINKGLERVKKYDWDEIVLNFDMRILKNNSK